MHCVRQPTTLPALAAVFGITACAASVEPQAPAPPSPTAGASTSANTRKPQTPEAPPTPLCGKIECRLFDTPQQAFAAVIESNPVVVAVGEAHAQRGTEHLPSTAVRFSETLLPMLSGHASDLVVELAVGRPECRESEQQVEEKQAPVTETQAETNQNEYVKMGHRAKALGITPHPLRPTCEDFEAIAQAGDTAVDVMLRMVARLFADQVAALLLHNARAGIDRGVVTYGGLVHNDLVPREGRDAWSFGPKLRSLVRGRYVEVDLIVPEYIRDEPPWTSLPWVPRFDKTVNPQKVRLLNPSPGSYVLVFAQSDAPKAAPKANPEPGP